jgi:hypothetical protein
MPGKKQGGGGGISQILVTNFHRSKSDALVLGDLSRLFQEKSGRSPTFADVSRLEPFGIKVSVPDKDAEALRALTGTLILHFPIWIIKLPSEFGIYSDDLATLFTSQCLQGFADLSQLKQKLNRAGRLEIDFNNLDFVEFLLWKLGMESRERMFWVATLVLTDNEIRKVDKWGPFFHFLPNLRRINLKGNKLDNMPTWPEWPNLYVVWEKSSQQKGQGKGQQQDGSRGDERGQRGGRRGGRGGFDEDDN